ncbi:MAG: DNA translocase FtsK [Syntrophaceae bacterium]|nr:DNA translocase FtsK [Syntrophaceae bacterium]
MAGKGRENNRRKREILGVVGLALSFFLFLSLISYSPADPSLTQYISDDPSVRNIFGAAGSYTADALIRLLGFGAFLIPILSLVASFRFFLEESFHIRAVTALGAVALLLACSGFLSLILPKVSIYGVRLQAGGLLGSILSGLLIPLLNRAGTFLLFLLVLLLSLMIVADVSVVTLGSGVKSASIAVWSALRRIGGKKAASRAMEPEPPEEKPAEGLPVPIIEAPEPAEKSKQKKIEQTHFDFLERVGDYQLPPLSLLDQAEKRDSRVKRDSLIANARILEKKLADFGVEGRVLEVKPGPVITMYELEPAPGVKINRITNLTDDLALALRAPSIRIIAPIPGKGAIGIEIPNHEREPVRLRNVLDTDAFREAKLRLPIALGDDIVGAPVMADLARMPHLLIAGTTGSGKSVSLNAMICSILFRATPDEVKFLLIDPKRLELSAYEGIPHLLHPVVVDPKKASMVLKWAVEEMERRYRIMGEVGAKGVDGYNRMIEKAKNEKAKRQAFGLESAAAKPEAAPEAEDALPPEAEGQALAAIAKAPQEHVRLPYIVIVIDELADLMMVAQRYVEESLARLAQMARAAGIHLILATQRPSVDVITGVIKANFPTRISFQVSSKVDSRTILDQLGAESLLGAGDMLFMPPGTSKLARIHGPFVSEKEIDRIVMFIKRQGQPNFDPSITEYRPETSSAESDEDVDEKYDEAVALVADLGQASISLVQRYLKVGYNRAARIIEHMEAEGIVGPADGAKPRKVLVKKL